MELNPGNQTKHSKSTIIQEDWGNRLNQLPSLFVSPSSSWDQPSSDKKKVRSCIPDFPRKEANQREMTVMLQFGKADPKSEHGICVENAPCVLCCLPVVEILYIIF